MGPICYFNGKFIPISEAKVPFTDRGLRWGDGVFETERTFGVEVFRLREHVDRLFRSLSAVRIDPGLEPAEIVEITEEVLRRNEPLRGENGDFWLTQTVTRGSGWIASEQVPATVCIRAYPLEFKYYANYYRSGCRVVITRTRAYSNQALEPKIKHISRMNFVMAELEAQDVDPGSYPVLLDERGNIAEYSAGNIMLVTDGVLRTPRVDHVLSGISRSTALQLASELGIETVEEDLQPYDAYNADEVFLTTTSFCVLPVSHVDKRSVMNGVPGPITDQLLEAWSEMVGVDIVGQAVGAVEG